MEPWGEERADLRSGVIACVIANQSRPKNRRPFQPKDFLLFGEPSKPEEYTLEELEAIAACSQERHRG